MIKADIARIVYETHGGISYNEAAVLVDLLLQMMKNTLQSGENVKLTGFGTLAVINRKSRAGRNPQTGETIELPASNFVSFRPSRSLEF
jgi:integration host factor subunit alpha